MTTGADWVEQARRLLEAVKSGAFAEAHPQGGQPTGECKWCPHCQLRAVLRGDRPEVTAALDDVLATASAALRSFAGETADRTAGETAGETPPSEPAGHEDEPSHRDPAPVVQRIEIA